MHLTFDLDLRPGRSLRAFGPLLAFGALGTCGTFGTLGTFCAALGSLRLRRTARLAISIAALGQCRHGAGGE